MARGPDVDVEPDAGSPQQVRHGAIQLGSEAKLKSGKTIRYTSPHRKSPDTRSVDPIARLVHKGASKIARLVTDVFDLTPQGMIDYLKLRRPIYRKTAAYGHFGRLDLDLPWERTDRAAALAR